jgi:tetratricopeptide (TPR) repeat protein
MGDRRGEASCLNNIGTVHNYLGEYEKALGQYHRALVIRQAIGDLGGQASTLGNIGKACLEMGAFPEAEEAFRQGERLVQGLGAKRLRAYLVDGLATLAFEQGRLSLAEERIGCLRSLAGEIRSREHEGIAFCLQGRLHVRRGEGAQAWAAFQEAMTVFKDIREDYELGIACYYYAQGLSQLVGAREAEWYRVQAREIFARLGAKGWLRKMGET